MTKTSIYHLLSSTLGQQISIAKVVDFDVLDEVAIGNVHLAVDGAARSACCAVLAGGQGGLDRGYVDMLNAFAALESGIDLRRSSSYVER